jgi:hypothetical protein
MTEKTSTPEDSIHNLRIASEALKDQGFHRHAELVEDGIWQIERLRAQVEQVKACFKYIDQCDWQFLLDLLEKSKRHSEDSQTGIWIEVIPQIRSVLPSTGSDQTTPSVEPTPQRCDAAGGSAQPIHDDGERA